MKLYRIHFRYEDVRIHENISYPDSRDGIKMREVIRSKYKMYYHSMQNSSIYVFGEDEISAIILEYDTAIIKIEEFNETKNFV